MDCYFVNITLVYLYYLKFFLPLVLTIRISTYIERQVYRDRVRDFAILHHPNYHSLNWSLHYKKGLSNNLNPRIQSSSKQKDMFSIWHYYYLSCLDSPQMLPHPCQILQKYTMFGASDTHPLTFLKSSNNIGPKYQQIHRKASISSVEM